MKNNIAELFCYFMVASDLHKKSGKLKVMHGVCGKTV